MAGMLMKKNFLTMYLFIILIGCSTFQEMSRIPDQGLAIKDKTILSFLRTTTLKNIDIQASDLPEAIKYLF